jgi:hypothetical protein
MPVIEGYSRNSFDENVAELHRRLPESQALAASYKIGRKAWRRRHGKMAPYPPHLREPHGHLLPRSKADNPGSGASVHSLEELRRHGLDYWKSKPTISSGQTHNLKYDDGKHRVWVTRMTPEDYDTRAAYENEKLVFERHFDGRWRRVAGESSNVVVRSDTAKKRTKGVYRYRVKSRANEVGGAMDYTLTDTVHADGRVVTHAKGWEEDGPIDQKKTTHVDTPIDFDKIDAARRRMGWTIVE